jgi:hypothetical protein
MGKYRGGPKPSEKDDPKGRRLDPGQYPELNAVFYTADPAEFIKIRIESLSLMACSDDQLGPPAGLTAPDFTLADARSTCSPINRERPVCSASSSTGTNPAADTRFCSSHAAESRVKV